MSFADRIDPLLSGAVERGELAGVVATVESDSETLYAGAAGHFEPDGAGPAYDLDTPLRIASMTKAVTSVAAMQLVERGQLDLDAPASKWLPDLEARSVIEADGTLHPARTPITARQLLSHTSGFAYEIWNGQLASYLKQHPLPPSERPGAEILGAPLVAEPGTAWHYSISTDWVGELVSTISGQPLGEYFTEHIFRPLGMTATRFYDVAGGPEVASLLERQSDGSLALLQTPPRKGAEAFQSGGSGLQSTARDYGRFLRMMLGNGGLEDARMLEAATVGEMAISQTGDLSDVGVLASVSGRSNSDDMSFGHAAGFGLGFLITLETSRTGRTAGSLSWAGMFNTYYWIDLERNVAGALYTQVLPFLDRTVLDLTREFERATYESING